jgi:hypothetical protein
LTHELVDVVTRRAKEEHVEKCNSKPPVLSKKYIVA